MTQSAVGSGPLTVQWGVGGAMQVEGWVSRLQQSLACCPRPAHSTLTLGWPLFSFSSFQDFTKILSRLWVEISGNDVIWK